MQDCVGHRKRLPVVIVPGFASSALEVRESKFKKAWVGKRVWVSLEMLLKKMIAPGNDTMVDDDGNAAAIPPSTDELSGESGTSTPASSRSEGNSNSANLARAESPGDDLRPVPPPQHHGRRHRRQPRDSFVMSKDSTQQAIDTGHALVRHLTLQQARSSVVVVVVVGGGVVAVVRGGRGGGGGVWGGGRKGSRRVRAWRTRPARSSARDLYATVVVSDAARWLVAANANANAASRL
jgi:hypothetical protein